METATVVSFLLDTVPATLALNMVELSGWVLVFPRQMSKRGELCVFSCLQRIFTSFLHTCSRLEESSKAVV